LWSQRCMESDSSDERMYAAATNTKADSRAHFVQDFIDFASLNTESLTDEELHNRLKSGRWNISLGSISELKSAV
jgi:hypothetical protein